MASHDHHFTVFIRLPFKRGDFVDPPPVAWSATKERELWDVISRQSKDNDVDWASLADRFQVTQQFLLQQAAWLYERQLSQVRAQMRRMGNRQSATASPAPSSAAASMIGFQPSKRPPGLSSRGPSRLATQTSALPASADTSISNAPAINRSSLPLKSNSSGGASGTGRGQSISSRPLSRKSSRDNELSSRTHSRRGSVQHPLPKSPTSLTSSSEDEMTTRATHRRPPTSSSHRRTSSMRKSQHNKASLPSVHQLQRQQEEEEDDDDPAFLPFANTSYKTDQASAASTDPSATLRGELRQPPPLTRPNLQRNPTSERIKPTTSTSTGPTTNTTFSTAKNRDTPQPQSQSSFQPQYLHQLTSSTSSLSSSNNPLPTRHLSASTQPTPAANPSTHRSPSSTSSAAAQPAPSPSLPTPLSPHQQAALATAAGLSPRRRAAANPHGHTQTGSESSPSMGSSFSDLDDASVTQSALEEALMSNMNTMGSTAGIGGLGSRVSGISQALRSRYFDARAGSGSAPGGNGGAAHGESSR